MLSWSLCSRWTFVKFQSFPSDEKNNWLLRIPKFFLNENFDLVTSSVSDLKTQWMTDGRRHRVGPTNSLLIFPSHALLASPSHLISAFAVLLVHEFNCCQGLCFLILFLAETASIESFHVRTVRWGEPKISIIDHNALIESWRCDDTMASNDY